MSKPVFTTKSSTIHRVDYNEKEKVMEIEFRTGNVYRYYNVPPRMWKIFQLYIECEGSAGSFFNEYIKNQFTSEKMSGKEEWRVCKCRPELVEDVNYEASAITTY